MGWETIAIVALIGLVAGVMGGMAGIGGSLIMLPLLALTLGYDDEQLSRHHVFMAAAMIVNVLVSLPAAVRHHRAGVVRLKLVYWLLPVMAITILLGVWISNRFDGWVLKYLLAGFIAAYCVLNLWRAIRGIAEPGEDRQRATPGRLVTIGGLTGVVAGLLGIGGGIMMVPMLQVFTRIRIRHAIGTSSAVMVLTAVAGATFKNASLGQHGRTLEESLMLAAAMGPTAAIGGMLGASLAHRLPTQALRVILSILLLIAAGKLADVDRHARDLLERRSSEVDSPATSPAPAPAPDSGVIDEPSAGPGPG